MNGTVYDTHSINNGNVVSLNSKIYGKSIFLASVQVALASIEMPGRFHIIISTTDQETLQNAGNALSTYLITGLIWTAGCMALMYSAYGRKGLISAFLCNILVMFWIYVGYMSTFRKVSKKYGLKTPKLFEHFN